MKITVDISENDLEDIKRLTGEKKKGPAIVKLVADALMLRRRRELSDELISGKLRIEFPHWEETRAREKKHDRNLWHRSLTPRSG